MSLPEQYYITTTYTFFLSCGCVKKSKVKLSKGNTIYCPTHHDFVKIVDVKVKKFEQKIL